MTGKTRTPVSSNAGWPPRLGRQVAYEEAARRARLARVGGRGRRRRTSRGRWLRRSVFIFSQESLPTAHVLAYAQHSRTAITNGAFLDPLWFFLVPSTTSHPPPHDGLPTPSRKGLSLSLIWRHPLPPSLPPFLSLSLAQRYSGPAPGDTHICIHPRFRRGAQSHPSRPVTHSLYRHQQFSLGRPRVNRSNTNLDDIPSHLEIPPDPHRDEPPTSRLHRPFSLSLLLLIASDAVCMICWFWAPFAFP